VTRRPVWLVVCGERERGDDAAGPIAVDALPSRVLRGCKVQRAAALDVQTLLDVPPEAACVLVDAAVGIEPGAVVVLPIERLGRRARGPGVSSGASPRSSHELPVDQVLGLARIVRDRLPDGSFVGVGAASAGFGAPLSPAVEAALPAFRAAIAVEIERLAAGCGTIGCDGDDPGPLRRDRGALPDVVGAGAGADRVAPPRTLPTRGG
jgi:hydrogenase maturation protease